jgi:sugar lactone lactonase YvrE
VTPDPAGSAPEAPPGWSVALPAGVELGERPLWDDATGTLVWVDILAGDLHRWRPGAEAAGGHAVIHLGPVLGTVGLRAGGGVLAAVTTDDPADSAVLLLDAAGRPDADPVPLPLPAGVQFNDGAVDPVGGFVVGTADAAMAPGRGSLYRVAPDRTVAELLDGITESNGVGWSPDGRTLYYVDSGEPTVRVYDWDPAAGRLGPRRADLVTLPDGAGCPDGLVADAAGTVWTALWEGAAVQRLAPDGQLLATLAVPVTLPTCPGFGPLGGDRSLLYLTTSYQGLDPVARAAQPWAGHLLVADVTALPGARGLAPHRFGQGWPGGTSSRGGAA